MTPSYCIFAMRFGILSIYGNDTQVQIAGLRA